MTAGLGRGIALAVTGVVVGLAIVAALFGTGDLLKRVRGLVPGETSRPSADLPQAGADRPSAKAPETDAARPATGDQAAPDKDALDKQALAGPDRSPQAETGEKAPSLDILRVEPSGEAVLAGRGAPKASIELLRDNQPIARVTADESGQFAMDSLALPPGNSELTLRSTAADGKATEGKASAVVVVDKDRKAQPLVAVSEPDKPTRVLSMPGPIAEAGKGPPEKEAGKQAEKSAPKAEAPPRREAALPQAGGKPPAQVPESVPVKIVSVDAQEGGRLYVSGQGAAWTSLRLYLNDTLVASGRSGADGRIAFTIGRGVRPGGYQIRIDQVEPETGKVAGRAQVGFNFPIQLAAKEPVKEPTKMASKEPPAAPSKPETQASRPAEKPSPTPPASAKAPSTEASSVAGGGARPDPASKPSSPESGKPAAEALASTTPKAEPSPGRDAATSSSTPPAPPKVAEAPAPTPSGSGAAASGEAGPSASEATVFVPEIETARITRGDNLWQISRRSYGDGRRYTVIYDANRDQIRDPNLIYPGQIFVMPKDAAPAADRQGARRG